MLLLLALLLLALFAACACVEAVEPPRLLGAPPPWAEAREAPPTWSSERAGQAALQAAAQGVASGAVAAATARPPSFPPQLELGPQRLWQPTFLGCAPTFVDLRCDDARPTPQQLEEDLERRSWERNAAMGQTNVEPLKARQALVQLLTMDWRSRRDPYTRATPGNSLSMSTCREKAEA